MEDKTNKTALISVYDKRGIVNFAKSITDAGYKIISTSGTAKLLKENGINVIEISEITKFPEILNGRVKTLHPAIFGGLLADKSNERHILEIKEHNIMPIDMVVVNLYPFKDIISRDHSINEAIENIDIGGVSLIRAAAKNYKNVAVVVDPNDYDMITEKIKHNPDRKISASTRERLCVKAFAYVSDYDIVIHNYFSGKFEKFSSKFFISGEKFRDIRYGENPHQKAVVYKTIENPKNFILDSVIYEGKKLSFNNILDLNLALKVVGEFKDPACCVVKHAIPNGVAIGKNLDEAYDLAYKCDPKSAFGGIFAFNGKVTEYIANSMSKIFFECVIAKDYDDEAINILKKKKNVRILKKDANELKEKYDIRKFSGGFMVQEEDKKHLTIDELKNLPVVTNKKPTDEEYKAMWFAERVVKYVRSNAIVLSKSNGTGVFTVGIGSGQTSRVDAVKFSIMKANEDKSNKITNNAVLASDAFFPFRDGIDEAAKGGISAVIQPGGSIRDKEVIDACNEHNIAMVFTNIRHFLH